ncbi:Non-homologous end-joining factor 1 [Bagarius yarrelli]|uniref:Non-homologous end-joining factor 1 n=1 Tax=Bagarius yarrelli TaxID=175774 RepID=A0A556V8G4_BAGYA|nr:Non-homologous end-joining factor 1 [Bagarius yarrelli]
MENTGHTEGDLSALPWVPVNFEGSKLLAKAWFGDKKYRLLLSDQSHAWEEEMSTNSIRSRAQARIFFILPQQWKVLNKRLRAPVDTVFSHLRSVAWPFFSRQSYKQTEAVHIVLEHQGDHLTLKLKSELADVPFYWEFCCTPAPVSLVFKELVCPLLYMTQVLHRHVKELTALLLKKDAEIQDYKENGALLSRGRLQTEQFEEERHRKNFNQRLPMMLQDSPEFDSEIQELYTSIHAARNTPKRKHSAGEYSSVSLGSFITDQDQITCVQTEMRPASPSFNLERTRQQVENTLSANTKEVCPLN